MPVITRRQILTRSCGVAMAASAFVPSLSACRASTPRADGQTRVHVFGTIHGRHRTSKTYSLDVFEAAIRRAAPDVILTEIPPQRVATALRTFKDTGRVDEPRTNVFPEYTDVIIPLSERENWRVIGTAAWTPEIGRGRAQALKAIREDPARAAQWAEHEAARRTFTEKVRGRSDDPRFIHTPEFDSLVAASRGPYERYFGAELGAGGWAQINAAHNALIHSALDTLSGQGFTIAITFGTAHKYKILESLGQRDDVALDDTRALFS